VACKNYFSVTKMRNC